jgi:ubiquinone/menaquinone biosynthesis C-methylase UbiE
MDNLSEYYSKRAKEYEKIYHRDDPVRQNEQKRIEEAIKEVFRHREVLEIACGTGHWTVFLSQVAKSITAIDNSDEVLAIARSKYYKNPVNFHKSDAYRLPHGDNSFGGGLANFWFSHVPKEKIQVFLDEFHRVLKNYALVFMADNVYNEGLGGKLVQKEGGLNTYKIRTLEDGNEYEILKNYYTESQLREIFGKYDIQNLFYGKCFWFVRYKLIKK